MLLTVAGATSVLVHVLPQINDKSGYSQDNEISLYP